ncbi:MAG: Ig-like domain-containing protein [Aquabacterium sp.]
MSNRAPLSLLAACLLAGATLVGCGGGDAEAPPPPIGNRPSAPDTTPPTVQIANNVPGPVANGPVTFTFVFSEDVGVSFEAGDVVVAGGTAGGFARVDGRQATLVVTPTPGMAGQLSVSVAAGRFSDIAGNANAAAASATKDYIASQTITFASPGNQTIGVMPPALVATSSSNLPVTIVSTTTSVCTVSGRVLTLVSGGSCSLTASQAGDSTYGPADPVIRTFTVSGGVPVDLVFSTGFAGGNRTPEGGAYFSYSGSNLDGFNCTGAPGWCGSGDGGTGPTSFYFSYYQTPSAATALYNGISVLAPGVTTVSATGDTGGVQVNGQTTLEFTFNNNPEWQSSGTNNFGVLLTLGKFYDLDGGPGVQPCNIKLLAVVTPLNNGAATLYRLNLSSFQIIQACNSGINTVAAALASAPVSEVAFQAAGGGAALPPVNGLTTGANLSVVANGVYPTTLALTGGIKFGAPPAPRVSFSTGFAGGNRTPEGGAYFSYSGSNLDGFNCTGGPGWCGSGDGGTGPTSFFFAYYQTPSAATALYNGISVLAPGVTAVSGTGNTAGVQLTTQTTVNFTFNNNPEWQSSGTNNFGVLLTLGKFYDLDGGPGVTPCNIKLLAVVTPLNNGAATAYAVPLSSFQIIQACNSGINTVTAALASSPVSEVAFQAAGGGAALPPVNGRTTGANLSVAANGVYPTTLALTGGISFEP